MCIVVNGYVCERDYGQGLIEIDFQCCVHLNRGYIDCVVDDGCVLY